MAEHNAGMKVSNLYISQVKKNAELRLKEFARCNEENGLLAAFIKKRDLFLEQFLEDGGAIDLKLVQVLIYLKKKAGNRSVKKIKSEIVED